MTEVQVRLAACDEALLNAIAALVHRARSHDPRVGAHVHIDGTEDETHAALIHDCRPEDPCPYRARLAARRAGRAKRPGRVSTEVARKSRQADNAAAVPTTATPDERLEIVERDGRLVKRIYQGGCWYRTNDLDAGIRAYTGQRGARRFWTGYYQQKAIDHFTGGVLFPGVYNASVMEFDQLPDIYEKTSRIIGTAPETLIADKGHSISAVFERLIRGGTAPIIPWRPAGAETDRHDRDTHDRHGVPRCKHCGGPTTFRRFSARKGPRIWFRCLTQPTAECAADQTIRCSTD